MKVLLALIIGIVIGAAGLWLYTNARDGSAVGQTTRQVEDAAKSAGQTLQEKFRALGLGTNEIKEELARTGRVIRRKAGETGQAIADATADARLTAAVKARLLTEPGLPSSGISVNTTDGIVTLSGAVPAAEDISRAMIVALETGGVKQVISTIQLKGRAGAG